MKYIITDVKEQTIRYLVEAESEAEAMKIEPYSPVAFESICQDKRIRKAELHSSLVKASAIVEQPK